MATVRADPIAYLVASWRPGATPTLDHGLALWNFVAGLRPIGIVELRGEVERRQRLSTSYRASADFDAPPPSTFASLRSTCSQSRKLSGGWVRRTAAHGTHGRHVVC